MYSSNSSYKIRSLGGADQRSNNLYSSNYGEQSSGSSYYTTSNSSYGSKNTTSKTNPYGFNTDSYLQKGLDGIQPSNTTNSYGNTSSMTQSSTNKQKVQEDKQNYMTSSSKSTIMSQADRGLCGLSNIGNTCFLQSLHPQEKNIAQTYYEVISKVHDKKNNNNSVNPSSLQSAVERVYSQFRGYDQQDSQQFMRKILEGISEDMNRVKDKPKYQQLKADITTTPLQEISEDWFKYNLNREDSVVTDYFTGQLLSIVTCQKCQSKYYAFDNFMELSLSFYHASRVGITDFELTRMLDSFFKEESLSDDYYCQKCKQQCRSKRKFSIWRLPQVLVIHFKRFHFGSIRREQINSSVSFDVKDFDMSKYTENSNHSSVKDSLYNLHGIINHSGSLYGGHYTAQNINI